ncbi:MAG: acyltransferase family protein [Candidatus Binatia bacterium]
MLGAVMGNAASRLRAIASGLAQTLHRGLFQRGQDHFPALDGLRAIAALLVVGFHSALVRNGWIGVDLFFVLSGFLIGRILFTQLAGGGINFRGFYVRRIFRIFPAYYAVLSMSVAVSLFVPIGRPLTATWGTILLRSVPNYLYVSNYLYGTGWWIPNALAWGWSLCIEEHFYLIAPALLTLLWRGKAVQPRRRAVVLAVLALVPLVFRLAAFVRDPTQIVFARLYPESHTHCEGLWCGVLVAYGYVYHRAALEHWVRRSGRMVWLLGLACIGSVYVWGGVWQAGFFAAVVEFSILAIGSSLLVLCGLFLDDWFSRLLAHRMWYPWARLSYGIYLVHPFGVFWLVYGRPAGVLKLGTAPFALAVLALATLAATILLLVVEQPLLERGARLSRRLSANSDLARPRVPEVA